MEMQGQIKDSQHIIVLLKSLTHSNAVGVFYVDFRKASKKVLSGKPVHKVRSHAIKGELTDWT